jgi:hypothetical protein
MVKKLPINIIVEAKVFIVGNNAANNVSLNYDGVYTVERGDNVTVVVTALTAVGLEELSYTYLSSDGTTVTDYIDELEVGETMSIVVPITNHTIFLIEVVT